MRKLGWAVVVLAALAAFGAIVGDDAPRLPVEVLESQPEATRRAALRDTVRSAGFACEAAVASRFLGRERESSSWSVTCAGGGAFVVIVAADFAGSTSVADCSAGVC